MKPTFSFELPPAVSNLVSQNAFDNYTLGGPNTELQTQLAQLSADDIFPATAADAEMADCCLSGLWLLHNFLDQSHNISQEVHTSEGSFWHAIMHRLEGDYWNSKYWYRKVGAHTAYQNVEPNWNPEAYVDACESIGKEDKQVHQTAIAEWKALFEHCYINAGG